MKISLHLHNPATRFLRRPAVTFKAHADTFKNMCLVGVMATLVSACNDEPLQAASSQPPELPESSKQMVATSCDSSTLLLSFPDFADFESVLVDDSASLIPKFSKHIDIEGQAITKFQRKDGLRMYEASPIITPLKYEGSWKTYRRKQSIYAQKTGYIASYRGRLRYKWEAGAFVKDPVSKMYSMKPTKFKIFLSHQFEIPEWHAVGEVTDRQRARWDYLSCRTALHERTHAEITRGHILGMVEEILDLEEPTPDKLKDSIRKSWKYQLAELKVKQKFFDAETKRKRRQQALNK